LLSFIGSPLALEFLMGIAVARLPRRTIFGLFIPLGLALLPFTPADLGDLGSTLGPHWALRRAFEWGCPSAFVVLGALSLESVFAHRLFDVPVKIGDASYSIYLFHPIISYGLDFSWPIRLVLSLGVGLAMYSLVERRLMAARAKPRASRARVSRLQEA
jgi:peptidoglycan/LPS O-acetylase OafA/YrhL